MSHEALSLASAFKRASIRLLPSEHHSSSAEVAVSYFSFISLHGVRTFTNDIILNCREDVALTTMVMKFTSVKVCFLVC